MTCRLDMSGIFYTSTGVASPSFAGQWIES